MLENYFQLSIHWREKMIKHKYVCSECGYVHKEDMPEGFECPICGCEEFEDLTDYDDE